MREYKGYDTLFKVDPNHLKLKLQSFPGIQCLYIDTKEIAWASGYSQKGR